MAYLETIKPKKLVGARGIEVSADTKIFQIGMCRNDVMDTR